MLAKAPRPPPPNAKELEEARLRFDVFSGQGLELNQTDLPPRPVAALWMLEVSEKPDRSLWRGWS